MFAIGYNLGALVKRCRGWGVDNVSGRGAVVVPLLTSHPDSPDQRLTQPFSD